MDYWRDFKSMLCCWSESEQQKDKEAENDPNILIRRVPKAGPHIILFALKGTVVARLFRQLFVIVLWTCIVTSLSLYEKSGFFFADKSHTMIPILGTVTGLLLTFRANTAYDRYYEGRRLWSTMTQHARTLARYIVVQVPEQSPHDILGKRAALNLIIAFSFSVKNYLRESYDYTGVFRFVGHIPEFNKEFLAPKKIKRKFVGKCPDGYTPTKIPMDISYHICSYIHECKLKTAIDAPTANNMQTTLNSMVECFTNLERIKNTPIPLSYAIHLHMVVWIYLLTLPTQLVAQLQWWTVPSVGVAAFTFMGLLDISWEIENPFGKDANDLPLGRLCKLLEREILTSASKRMPRFEELFKSKNFRPVLKSHMSAEDFLAMDVSRIQEHLNGPVLRKEESVDLDERTNNMRSVPGSNL